jgi:hypothetical protein
MDESNLLKIFEFSVSLKNTLQRRKDRYAGTLHGRNRKLLAKNTNSDDEEPVAMISGMTLNAG